MKPTIFFFFAALVAIAGNAQTLTRVPIQLVNGQFVVDVPTTDGSNTTATVTNVPSPRIKLLMTNNVIAPVAPRTDLVKLVSGPTTFTLGAFPQDSDFVLFIFNTASNKMTWPKGIRVFGSPLPTNQARAYILFEWMAGEVWASPVVEQ